MGWQTIAAIVAIAAIIVMFLCERIQNLRAELEDWKRAYDHEVEARSVLQSQYDSLLEKIRERANLTQDTKKEDDSVIKARNAGDVRRQFEKAMGEQNVHQTSSTSTD